MMIEGSIATVAVLAWLSCAGVRRSSYGSSSSSAARPAQVRRAGPYGAERASGRMVRALLFDFDGPLLDTEGACSLVEFYERTARAPATDWSPDRHDRRLRRRRPPGRIHRSPARRGGARGQAPARADLAIWRSPAGGRRAVHEADTSGLATAIVSSASEGWIARHLERRELLLYGLHTVVAANGDHQRAKLRPTLYLEALDRLGVEAGAVVVRGLSQRRRGRDWPGRSASPARATPPWRSTSRPQTSSSRRWQKSTWSGWRRRSSPPRSRLGSARRGTPSAKRINPRGDRSRWNAASSRRACTRWWTTSQGPRAPRLL